MWRSVKVFVPVFVQVFVKVFVRVFVKVYIINGDSGSGSLVYSPDIMCGVRSPLVKSPSKSLMQSTAHENPD